MGLISWFKRKFNIGGVKVKILEVEDPVTEAAGHLRGKSQWTASFPAVVETTYKLICETTTGSGQDKKSETSTIGEITVMVGAALEGGDTAEEEFSIPYDFRNWFAKRGGVLGTAAKIGSFLKKATSDSYDEYYVEVAGNVKGVWNSPTDRKKIDVAVDS